MRDFGNWTRKGPLSPLPQQERGGLRDGGRPRTNDGPAAEGFRDRRTSPAQWGEGRPAQGSQDGGSRPPRREFQERPVVERTPTAAEQDNQWRTKMKPDAPAAKSPITSREGSEAPSSPAVASAAPVSRPKLNLAKRTVSEAPDQASPTSAAGDAKASPFGAARPIDTAAKEKEIEEKRLAAIKEKKEAEEKAKEEKKEAAKAAKAAETAQAAEKQEGAEADATEAPQKADAEANAEKTESQNGTADSKPKPAETGAWRRPSGQGPPSAPRDDIPRGPRGGRGGRGGGVGRGRYNDEGRGGRQNSNGRPPAPTGPAGQAPAAEAEAAAPEEDGWSTVSKPKKSNRGGSQAPRPIAS